jgi:cell division septal protein FtsQ
MRTIDPHGRAARRWAIAGLGLVVIATVAVSLTYTPLFAAGDIRIDTGGLPQADVLSIARLTHRSNVFHLDTVAVERRLERDPRVLRATVTTSLPDRIRIAIVPRVPVAVVGTPAELVGADGVVIGPAGSTTELPTLRTADGRAPTASGLRAAAATAGALDADLDAEIEAVVVAADGTVRVRLRDGLVALIGDASELHAKAASLAALLTWVQDEAITIVSADVSVPGSPTAKLERGAQAVAVP